jgi:hypothetical protein
MALLYGHAGRLTSQNGGFRPGQIKQYPNGRKGIYELLLLEMKPMTLKAFKVS